LAIQARSVPPLYVRSVAPHARSVSRPYDRIGTPLRQTGPTPEK
jgi:hypothetical protein